MEPKVFNMARPLADVFLSRSRAATVAARVSDTMHAGNVVPRILYAEKTPGSQIIDHGQRPQQKVWLSFVGAASKLLIHCVGLGFQLFLTSYLLVL